MLRGSERGASVGLSSFSLVFSDIHCVSTP